LRQFQRVEAFKVVVGFAYPAMNKWCNGQIPSSVGGHAKTKEGPYPVVVKWWNEHCGGTTSPKYVGPSPFVQVIIDVVYITAYKDKSLYIYLDQFTLFY